MPSMILIDYESILTDWDKTKTELYIDTQSAITSIQNALDESSQLTENVSQILKYLEETKHELELLYKNIDTVVARVKY